MQRQWLSAKIPAQMAAAAHKAPPLAQELWPLKATGVEIQLSPGKDNLPEMVLSFYLGARDQSQIVIRLVGASTFT